MTVYVWKLESVTVLVGAESIQDARLFASGYLVEENLTHLIEKIWTTAPDLMGISEVAIVWTG